MVKENNQQEIQELKVFLKDLISENQKFCCQIEELTNKLNSKKIEYEMFELLNKTIPIIKKNKPNLYEQCLLKNIETEFEELCKKLELLNASFE